MIGKLLVLFFCIAAAAAFDIPTYGDAEVEWAKFKKDFNKNYSPEEEARRFQIFKEHLEEIKAHNARAKENKESYSKGINSMADLTDEEFRDRYTNKIKRPQYIEDEDSEEVAWARFKAEFNRKYETEVEEKRRKDIFLETFKHVKEHNKKYHNGEVSYSQGINDFADLTQEEFARTHLMRKPHINV